MQCFIYVLVTSPLMLAVENRDAEMVKILLQHNSDVLQKYSQKQNVLHVAVQHKDVPCVKAILQNSGILHTL